MKTKLKFARGFRLPKVSEIDKALGENNPFPNTFRSTFGSISTPKSDNDWLVKHKEKGQTYDTFVDQSPFVDNESSSKTTIYLTLFDQNETSPLCDMDKLVDYTKRFFQMPVEVVSIFSPLVWNEKKSCWTARIQSSNEEIFFETRYDSSSGHSQILTQSVLRVLKRFLPKNGRCLVAVTTNDFYSDSTDLFIAGLANGARGVAAFSIFRYDPRLQFSEELWFDWKLKKSSRKMKATILLRSCRLFTHEIGHLLGFGHCIYHLCLMNGSGHLEEDFSQPLFLCPVDLRKLQRIAKFDLIQRFDELLEFCVENQFTEESQILEQRISTLKEIPPKENQIKITKTRSKTKKKRLQK